METKDHQNEEHKEQEEGSPYQELYGKKEQGSATGGNDKKAALDNAGAFGSASRPPGPESKSEPSDYGSTEDDRETNGQTQSSD